MRVFTQTRKVEDVRDPATVVTDLSTTVRRVAKVGSIIIAYPKLPMVTHTERLEGVPACCRHRYCWPSTAFSKAHDQARGSAAVLQRAEVDLQWGSISARARAGTTQAFSFAET